jgi:hypothetical protein
MINKLVILSKLVGIVLLYLYIDDPADSFESGI